LREDIALVDRTIQQVRNLSLDLRPPTLDVLGLEPTLRAYLDDQAQRTGLAITLRGHLESRLPPELEVTCYRLVQATLTNVVRHAKAHAVSVELDHSEHELQVYIRDDGIGFDVPSVWQRAMRRGSFGLMGIQERVELIGGRLQIKSSLGQGTTIAASFPLEAVEGVTLSNGE
jgi:signal transduction histidine kinase